MTTPLQQAQRQLAAFIRQIAEVPDEELGRMLALFRLRSLPAGGVLLRAGEQPRTLGFIASGLLRLYYLDAEGNEFTKTFCAENEIVAAYSALILGLPSRMFIEALEPTLLLEADYAAYRQVIEGHSCWQMVLLRMTEWLFIKKEQREAELLLDDAQTRYLQFLADYPQLEGRVRQHHIASYLGITPVSLSRIRARLREVLREAS